MSPPAARWRDGKRVGSAYQARQKGTGPVKFKSKRRKRKYRLIRRLPRWSSAMATDVLVYYQKSSCGMGEGEELSRE